MKDENFVKMMNGELSGPNAFMTGKLKFKGAVSQAMKLRGLLFG
jgi:putative sterol carrier protein